MTYTYLNKRCARTYLQALAAKRNVEGNAHTLDDTYDNENENKINIFRQKRNHIRRMWPQVCAHDKLRAQSYSE